MNDRGKSELSRSSAQNVNAGGRERILFNFIRDSATNRGEKFVRKKKFSDQFVVSESDIIRIDGCVNRHFNNIQRGIFESESNISGSIFYEDEMLVKSDSIDDIFRLCVRKNRVTRLSIKWTIFDINSSGDASYSYVSIEFSTEVEADHDSILYEDDGQFISVEVGGGDQAVVKVLIDELSQEVEDLLYPKFIRWIKHFRRKFTIFMAVFLFIMFAYSLLGEAVIEELFGIDLDPRGVIIKKIFEENDISKKIDLLALYQNEKIEFKYLMMMLSPIFVFGLLLFSFRNGLFSFVNSLLPFSVIAIGESGRVAEKRLSLVKNVWLIGIFPVVTGALISSFFFWLG